MNMLTQNYPRNVDPGGYVAYAAAQMLYPIDIQVRSFATLDKPWPSSVFMGRIGDQVKKACIEYGSRHLASTGWKGVNALDGTAKGKTMILCGSGRSILKNVKELVRLKPENCIVVPINGALKAMPPGTVDIYFTLDWLSNPNWWAGIDPVALHPGIKGVFGLSAPSALIEAFPERYYFPANYLCAEPEKAQAFMKEHGFLAECELASHSAMHLAYRMGCSRIILLGHDFAATPGEGGNYYHWDEPFEMKHSLGQDVKAVADIYDRATLSTEQLVKNAHVVNATAQMLEELGIQVWNCSEEGILGMPRTCPLEQALAEP